LSSEHRRPDHALLLFVLTDTATTHIYTLSLHDALPIWPTMPARRRATCSTSTASSSARRRPRPRRSSPKRAVSATRSATACARRSEEHTSELQSPYDLVCRLLLEKKKNQKQNTVHHSKH